MTSVFNAYIGLGSNLGNRFNCLQQAVLLISNYIGKVKAVSKVYQSPAQGFLGPEFLNACIAIETIFSAQTVLQKLIAIEILLDRKRTLKNNYENRTLDLDLLLFHNQIINTPSLKIPHPKLQDRLFVLRPLMDVAPTVVHPVYNRTMSELYKACKDSSEIMPREDLILSYSKRPCL